ncbi:phosphoribosylaminoimidazolesuccinocarboxamide synthase [Fodinibius sp.]|uniref:phosphoribosylaminoimidazolesuccinocarboxamide synthase n=1 Tax=Fodinibius sp. TaxID=1872440 RepID=UPI00356A3DF7
MNTSIDRVISDSPIMEGRSKRIYEYKDNLLLVELIPSLTSYTYDRHELVEGTDALRLDFYEKAVDVLKKEDIKTAFVERVDSRRYIARHCTNPPFEVIVKNFAIGSTLKFYPGLFKKNAEFDRPIVKFDYRTNPEDQPIAADYIREYGEDPEALKTIALSVNEALKKWMSDLVLVDFCLIFGKDPSGEYVITSEISPDGMRLKSESGRSLDKDLFRKGASHKDIRTEWKRLLNLI